MTQSKWEWQPLTEIYDEYSASLETAIQDGLLEDEEVAEDFIWPGALHIHSSEQDEVKRYVSERMTEIIERVKRDQGFDPNLIAGYIFRSVMCGMMWERDRYGK
jgi:hypothetical protein